MGSRGSSCSRRSASSPRSSSKLRLRRTRRGGHAEYYLGFAEPGSLPFDSDELTAWLSGAELERANLRVALGWLIEYGTADQALLLARRLSSLWLHRGPLAEGSDWLERALSRPAGDGALRASALGGRG